MEARRKERRRGARKAAPYHVEMVVREVVARQVDVALLVELVEHLCDGGTAPVLQSDALRARAAQCPEQAQRGGLQRRYRGGTGELQGSCTGDTGEAQGRCAPARRL